MRGCSTRDDAFPRFLDILNHRFLQLFFRAWADARPVAQHDRPEADRFETYIGSMVGLGSPAFRDLDGVPDTSKLAFSGLMAPQAKSASRLRSLIVRPVRREGGDRRVRRHAAEVRRGGPDPPRPEEQRRSASTCSSAASMFSVQDKIRIRVYTKNMTEYRSFLPTGAQCEPARRRGVLLSRRPARLGGGAGASRRRGRAGQAGQGRAARMDELDGAQLGGGRPDLAHAMRASIRRNGRRTSASAPLKLSDGERRWRTSASRR